MNWLFTPLARSSGQGALMIGVVWLVCRLFEQRLPASLRCTLWRLCHVRLLLGLVIAGGIALPILRAPAQSNASSPATRTAVSAERPAASATENVNGVPRTAATVTSTALINLRRPDWLLLLGVAYVAGLAICLIRLFLAWRRTRWLLRTAVRIADAACQATLAELSTKIGLRDAPRIAASDEISGPTYVSRVILLPEGCVYEPEAMRLILAHELAHARRRDLVYDWLGVLTQTIFYFHPLVHLARREERLARESAADALALRATGAHTATFGALLLELALKPQRTRQMTGTIGVFEAGSLLHRRLRALREASTLPANRKLALLPLAALLLLLPWYVTHAVRHKITPNVDFLDHSAAFPKIPHGNHSIIGHVRDDGGNLPGDVVVGLFQLRDGKSLESEAHGEPLPMITIHAEASGNYVLSGLPEGHFGISVMDYAGFRMDRDLRLRRSAVGRFAPTASEVTIKPYEAMKTVNLTASRGVTISGRILDIASGLPIANACVVSDREQAGGTTKESEDAAKTNPDGRYFLRILPGRVSAVVISVGGVQARTHGEKFNLSLGQNATYDFRITVPSH